MSKKAKKKMNFLRRQNRTRHGLHGTAERPRLAVYRSLRYLSAQAIDDDKGVTILGLNEKSLNLKGDKKTRAAEVGKELAKKLIEKNIKKIIFDRGAYRYHGRVKAFADGLREGGIEF